jgi:hypothetical protein
VALEEDDEAEAQLAELHLKWKAATQHFSIVSGEASKDSSPQARQDAPQPTCPEVTTKAIDKEAKSFKHAQVPLPFAPNVDGDDDPVDIGVEGAFSPASMSLRREHLQAQDRPDSPSDQLSPRSPRSSPPRSISRTPSECFSSVEAAFGWAKSESGRDQGRCRPVEEETGVAADQAFESGSVEKSNSVDSIAAMATAFMAVAEFESNEVVSKLRRLSDQGEGANQRHHQGIEEADRSGPAEAEFSNTEATTLATSGNQRLKFMNGESSPFLPSRRPGSATLTLGLSSARGGSSSGALSPGISSARGSASGALSPGLSSARGTSPKVKLGCFQAVVNSSSRSELDKPSLANSANGASTPQQSGMSNVRSSRSPLGASRKPNVSLVARSQYVARGQPAA